MPQHAPTLPNGLSASQTIGAYLQSLGYLTPATVAAIVYRQREQRRERFPLLFGDIAIRRGLVHPHVVTAVLLTQMIDRLLLRTTSSPKLLGEQLVVSGAVSPVELAYAIEHQLLLRQDGRMMRLGDILVLRGALDRQDLEATLNKNSREHTSELQMIELGA